MRNSSTKYFSKQSMLFLCKKPELGRRTFRFVSTLYTKEIFVLFCSEQRAEQRFMQEVLGFEF